MRIWRKGWFALALAFMGVDILTPETWMLWNVFIETLIIICISGYFYTTGYIDKEESKKWND